MSDDEREAEKSRWVEPSQACELGGDTLQEWRSPCIEGLPAFVPAISLGCRGSSGAGSLALVGRKERRGVWNRSSWFSLGGAPSVEEAARSSCCQLQWKL